jgi:hypothetical protein
MVPGTAGGNEPHLRLSGVAVGTMTAIITLVSGPLYGVLGARGLGHGAALCRCVADRVCDAQDFDQCIRVEADLAGASVVSCA